MLARSCIDSFRVRRKDVMALFQRDALGVVLCRFCFRLVKNWHQQFLVNWLWMPHGQVPSLIHKRGVRKL
jgi:hypothetical protein